ncbi:MAG: LptF/LptG family permease [Phycisphaerales bacterium]|nr:LptF/LptG family permease [Phycisphaerales bacterium]
MRRPPMRLWRTLLVEQWKLLLITTAVVVTVISFAATVKPLSDGKLDALDVPRYILFAVPPMLAYALPFAACFSATMTYHRVAQDNEAIGMYAAGISHRSLLFPALISGLVIAAGLLALNDRVIPRFLRELQRMVTSDIARVIARSVEAGQPVKLGDWVIVADRAYVLPDPPEGVTAQARLTRVAALKVGHSQKPNDLPVDALGVSASADIWLFPAPEEAGGTAAYIGLGRTAARREGEVNLALWDSAEFGPMVLPDAFQNDPEFLTSSELLALRGEPERMEFITYRKRILAAHLAEPLTIEAIIDDLRSTGRVKLLGPPDSGQTLYLSGADLRQTPEGWSVIPAPGRAVELEEYRTLAQPDPDAPPVREVARWTVNRAYLEASLGDPQRPELELRLRVRRAESAATEGISGERLELRFEALRFETDFTNALAGLPIEDLSRHAQQRIDARAFGWEKLVLPRGGMINRWERLQREIVAKINERLAIAFSGAVMVVIGAIAALRLRSASPLPLYLVSFLPALLALIAINGGQQFAHRTSLSGLLLLWAGPVVPAIGAAIGYTRLRRH